jgi:hypothetical protein
MRITHPLLRSPDLRKLPLQKISPDPSFSKRGIPPFCKGRGGGIYIYKEGSISGRIPNYEDLVKEIIMV